MPPIVSTLASSLKHVILLRNPRAGARCSKSMVDDLIARLKRDSFEVEIDENIEAATARANELFRDKKLRALIGIGGDGTVSALVNRTDAGVPLAILPAGTENLLAKYLGFRADPAQMAGAVRVGNVLRLDAGKASGKLFTLMVSAGFDADVIRRLHDDRSGHISRLTYARYIWNSLRNYKFPMLNIECEMEDGSGTGVANRAFSARWGFFFNLPRYAFNLKFAPLADGADHLLDMCLFERGFFWSGLKYLVKIMRQTHVGHAECKTGRVRRVRVTCDEPVPFQMDGEMGGWLPLEITVVPDRLCLITPQAVPVTPKEKEKEREHEETVPQLKFAN